jgi:colanic acid biosynthesis protein WcaH
LFLEKDIFTTVIESTPLVSIDLIVKNQDNKILLGQRLNRPAQGYWFVPGGRIYKDEKLTDAFNRITSDELGIKLNITDGKFLGLYEHFYTDNVFDDKFSTHYVVQGFELQITNTPITNNQHSNYKWFSIEELLNSNDVHQHTKDYFIDKKGIKSEC